MILVDTIFNHVRWWDSDTRPVYTSQELSKMMREKMENSGMSTGKYADSIGVPVKEIDGIINPHGLFSVEEYKLCSRVLELSIEKILAKTSDFVDDVYRSARNESDKQTFQMANMLFNEIIMQEKIAARQ